MGNRTLIRRLFRGVYWPAILGIIFAAGCAGMHIQTDYSRSIDFANYHTYSWLKVSPENSLWTDRIERDVNSQLKAKGWVQAPSGGQAAVAAFGSTREQHSLETFYDGFGPGFDGWGWWGWGWGGFGGAGYATTEEVNTPIGTLVVDIFNASSKQMIWRGAASDAVSGNPQKNAQKLEHAVADMFKSFPPASKG